MLLAAKAFTKINRFFNSYHRSSISNLMLNSNFLLSENGKKKSNCTFSSNSIFHYYIDRSLLNKYIPLHLVLDLQDKQEKRTNQKLECIYQIITAEKINQTIIIGRHIAFHTLRMLNNRTRPYLFQHQFFLYI